MQEKKILKISDIPKNCLYGYIVKEPENIKPENWLELEKKLIENEIPEEKYYNL
jgi:hypothetical protein